MEVRKKLVRAGVGVLVLGGGAAGIALLGAGSAANAATIGRAPVSQPAGSGPDTPRQAASHAVEADAPGGPQVQGGPGSTTNSGPDVNTGPNVNAGPDVNAGGSDVGGSAG